MNTSINITEPPGAGALPALEADRPTRGGSLGGIDPGAIERFRRNARNGHHPAASSGERVAARLANALRGIGSDLALLDAETLAGALDLVRCMAGPWPTDALRDAVFRTLESAAGKKLPIRKGAAA